MQVIDVRNYEAPRTVSSAQRSSLGGGSFVPPAAAMAPDRARLRRRPAARPQPAAAPSMWLAWVALGLLFTALVLALGFGQLGGALGLLLGWLSAAFIFLARRDLLLLMERAAR